MSASSSSSNCKICFTSKLGFLKLADEEEVADDELVESDDFEDDVEPNSGLPVVPPRRRFCIEALPFHDCSGVVRPLRVCGPYLHRAHPVKVWRVSQRRLYVKPPFQGWLCMFARPRITLVR